jgi:hypothetical protein
MTPKDIFVSIAVSRPEELDELPGALNGARRMAEWAKANSYLVVHTDDSELDVTVEKVRTLVETAINEVHEHDALRRIIFYFAGHGAAQGLDDTLWLLSKWHTDSSQAIRVPNLQRVLGTYHPAQVSIIGDSCRVTHTAFLDTLGSSVLLRRNETPSAFELDQFLAVEAGEAAFMVKAQGSSDSFCIFTEVLLDALLGDAPGAAIDRGGVAVITSGVIAKHLRKEVPLKAGQYDVQIKPVPRPGFLEPDDIYAMLKPPSITAVSGMPRSVDRIVLIPSRKVADEEFEPSNDLRSRENEAQDIKSELAQESPPTHYETASGITISGNSALDIAAPPGVTVSSDSFPTWFRVGNSNDMPMNRPFADLLVRVSADHWAYAFAAHNFITALTLRQEASVSVISRQIGTDRIDYAQTEEIVARMNARLISGDEAYNLAADIRMNKHEDFVLGSIAAHLYDSVGDTDNIRRIAAFYAENQQAVPFDVAVLTGDRIDIGTDRSFVLDISEVAKRQPRTEIEERYSYTFGAMSAHTGVPILGTVPLLRRTWTLLEICSLANGRPQAWQEFLIYVRRGLTAAPFTTLRGSSAIDLAGAIRDDRPFMIGPFA